MKFSIMGIDITLARPGRKEGRLTLSDIQCANDEVLDYIQSLDGQAISDRIASVTCELAQGEKEIKRVLEAEGIVVIPDFISPDVMARTESDIEEIRNRLSGFMRSDQAFEEDQAVLFQRGTARLAGYPALSGYGKAVVQVREGQDGGMVDIFNVDKWKVSLGETLRPCFEQEMMARVMETGNSPAQARNLNLYLNSDVTRTRGFHVDSYNRQLKGFIYLEDCLSLEDGPYTYVKQSHRESALARINKQVSSVLPNQTETPFVSLHNIVPVLARKGSLVISDQGGSHRGFPQSAGHQRAVAVMNFR